VHEPGLTSSAPPAPAQDPIEPAPALSATVHSAYRLSVTAPQRALMPALLPIRRQHMTAQPLQRGFLRQVLGMFVYRPAARVLRTFQVLTGRVERV
jgi:hypothetical protein